MNIDQIKKKLLAEREKIVIHQEQLQQSFAVLEGKKQQIEEILKMFEEGKKQKEGGKE